MQDIHSIGGGGGRLFSGGDRRLRLNHHQNHQALKCPRCDSLNTKFCYYNNYNLSQPRHFCKSCRRYWTKGGVLRNVPVGGGCRKTKRSKPKACSDVSRGQKSNSRSSSDSSSLTVSTTAAMTATATTAAVASELASASSSTSTSTLLNFPDSRLFNIPQTTNPSFDLPLIDRPSDGGIFTEIGSFTSLMTSSNDPSLLGFNVANMPAPAYRLHQQNQERVLENKNPNQQWEQQPTITSSMPNEVKMEEITTGFLDQPGAIDLSELPNRGSNDGLGALDWQAGSDQGLFDLTGTVDQAYWNETQWTDNDNSLYLP